MGTITVTVEQKERLKAINNLSEAILHVAKALASNVQVKICDNTFANLETGIKIDTSEDTKETMIEKVS